MSKAFDAALKAAIARIPTIPPKQDGTKRPDVPSWKEYQNNPPTLDQIEEWYRSGRTGVGWLTGGRLEVIDFDDRSIMAEFDKLAEDSGVGPLLNRIKAGYFEHSPNGAHLAYYCDEIEGNKKLAKQGSKTLIETRGEGGYIIVAPSHGSVNSSGEYVLISGEPDTIVTINSEERTLLHDLARVFDDSHQIVKTEPKVSCNTGNSRAGDDFNSRASWAEILHPHGWVDVYSRMQATSWRRPGKKEGISATTNHEGSDLLYVFSTNTPFEAERGYSKFSAYALLNHNSDFSAAAQDLSYQGYGSDIEIPYDVDLSGILEPSKEKDTSLGELLNVPGIVGELAQWIIDSAIKPQPELALGAALAACSTVLGRRVMTETRLYTNLYVLGVGHTGCGKENARQCVKKLFAQANKEIMVGDHFASGSAIETALDISPASLFLIDEIGHFFSSLRGAQVPEYIKNMVPMLLTLYGESSTFHKRRIYASTKKEDDLTIHNPCLSVYGTTVPENLYESITKDQLSNGLLGRFLVFESSDPDPISRTPDHDTWDPPQSISNWFQHWLDFKGEGGDLQPEPVVVRETNNATAVFGALEQRLRRKRQALRLAGHNQGVYTRIVANARKLSLIRACGIKPDPEITEQDAQWGADLAWLLIGDFAERVLETVSANDVERECKEVYQIVKSNDGISQSELTRKTQKMTSAQRKDRLKTLLESGLVVACTVATGRRPKTTYSVNYEKVVH